MVVRFTLSVNCPTCEAPTASTGTHGASQVLACISHCMPWPEDPGSLTRSHQKKHDRFILASCSLTHSPTTTSSISRLYQRFRVRDHPYGLPFSLSTLHLFCSPGITRLRYRRRTRYGLLARHYPTGTSTLQDAPSFAWRDNVPGVRRRPQKCQETWRVVPGVRTSRWLGAPLTKEGLQKLKRHQDHNQNHPSNQDTVHNTTKTPKPGDKTWLQ